MTTPDQLRALADAGESETLDFKRSTSERRAAMHALHPAATGGA